MNIDAKRKAAAGTVVAPLASGKRDAMVRVSRETQGRGGKGVSVITGLPLTQPQLDELARQLKKRCGCGGTLTWRPPAWDPDFNSADLPMMMRIADLPARYRRHFTAAAG